MNNLSFIENEDEKIVTEQEEQTEQVLETAEVTQEPKIYTEAEFNTRLNDVLGKKIARREAKIRKEYEREYGDLVEVLKAGTGLNSVAEIKNRLTDFYGQRGVKISDKKDYSAKDIEILARAEADDIVRSGFDEVVEEVDRLAKLGADKMSPREKAVFKALAEHRQNVERSNELSRIGVAEDVYNSEEFKSFASKFNPATPIADVYDIYAKTTQPKKEIQTMGSMTNKASDEGAVKDYYTVDEVRKFTKKDFDKNPALYEAVQKSMLKW